MIGVCPQARYATPHFRREMIIPKAGNVECVYLRNIVDGPDVGFTPVAKIKPLYHPGGP
jgi:hypothetical protein